LCTDKPSAAVIALLSSGAVVLGQFIGFLFIGVLLFAFYQPFNAPEYAQAGVAGSGIPAAFPFSGNDKVFPDFITRHMPAGLSGLVVAAIFAAALSSSLNSIAATATNDLYKPFAKDKSDKHLLRVASILTVVVGVVQIIVAIAVKDAGQSALNQALGVAGLINGPILGVFLVGTFIKKANQDAALVGMLTSIVLMLYVYFSTKIAFPWYPVIGSLTTLVVAFSASLIFSEKKD
jgi:Na+/proline symporter